MGVFQYEKVKDPTYYGENRVPAHSDHRYYGSVEEMEQHVENFRHSLNGLWKFHYAKNYESTIPGFETPEYDCTKWDDIRVPAHIQMEGYDAPQYANVQYPWEGREEIQPGEIPERFNPTASYVKYFEVPDQMKGKRLFVSSFWNFIFFDLLKKGGYSSKYPPFLFDSFSYFTAPVIPSVKLFWKQKKMIAVGIVQMNTPSISTP